jgi:hypothetical protein
VLWELRLLRPVLGEVQKILTALLERERMRSEQREKLLRMGGAVPEEFEHDVTDAVALPPPKRRTPPQGYPTGGEYSITRKKTHGE